MISRRATLQAIGSGALALAGGKAFADDPDAAITLYTGGGTIDASSRIAAEQLRASLGRPIVVVNKLGAGGRLALVDLKRSPPDGRTLVFSPSSPFTVYPNIFTRLDYDPVADFTPVAGVSWFDVAIACSDVTGAKDINQLIRWARGQPDPIFGCAPGKGSSSHFVGIALAQASGLKLTMVPYKDANGIVDLVAGRLPMLIEGTGSLAPLHKAGKLRILATSGDQRSPLLPEVPTLKESGLDVQLISSTGIYGPAGMAPERVQQLYAALAPLYRDPVATERLNAQGMGPAYRDSKQLAASLAAERLHYQQLVKSSGYVPEAL